MFGAAVLGVAACLILRTPRWLVWRVSGCTSRPTLNQLADVKPAHVIAVRVLGVVTALFAVGFAAAALVGETRADVPLARTLRVHAVCR